MRDQQLILPFGSLSMRKFFLSAAAIIMASLLYLFASAPTVQAQSTSNASWSGDSIVHNQRPYKLTDSTKIGDGHKLAAGTQIYAFIEPLPSDVLSNTKRLHLIYFAPGTDPLKAQSANAISFDFTPPNTYANPTGVGAITISSQPTTANTTSCNVMGIGWMVCPISTYLAKAMDWLFSILANFLTVTPLQSNPDNALFRGWSVMRNFANISFIIGFLVVIYSQLTSLGLSNYGLKKMLPRLIIAAILVNVSYWICTIAIDISNILGYSIQEVLMGLRDNVMGTNANFNTSDIDQTWERVTGAVLSGGAIGAGGLIAVASAGSITGAIFLLLPVLAFVILAALVAILIMAIRQALITVLVIVAPLAFVAFLLPNTEKYFERWRGIFVTMLVLFPVFALIFGGSQVAGTAIIQNADSIVMLILGMATQIAPLFVLPFMVKFSGGLIGQIAGIANNKSKGILDRTRNFAKNQADLRKSRVLSRPVPRTKFGRALRLKGMVQGAENRRLSREHEMKTNQTMAEANWTKHKKYQGHVDAAERANMLKETGETLALARSEASKHTNAAMQQLAIDARASKLSLDVSKAQVDANWDEIKAGDARSIVTPAGLAGASLASYIHNRDAQVSDVRNNTLDTAVAESRGKSAEHIQHHQFAEALENSQLLQQQAGGIDPAGAQRALAHALSEQYKARTATIDNANAIIEHSNLDGRSTLQLALGHAQGSITATDDITEAAIKKVAADGNIDSINQLMEHLDLSPTSNDNHRIAFVETLKKNSLRPKYIGFAKMDQIKQGVPGGLGVAGLDDMIEATINGGKLSAEVLVSQDQDALARISDAIQRNRGRYSQASLDNLRVEIGKVYSSDLLKVRVGERETPLQDILRQL